MGKRRTSSIATPVEAAPAPASTVALSSTQDKNMRKQHRRQQRRPKRIIVLGAGLSGLACSRELRQRGYEVLIVEARSRVGGRLKGEALELGAEYPATIPASSTKGCNSTSTVDLSTKRASDTESPADKAFATASNTTTKHPVDLGGALIHGIIDNPMHQITSQMGIPIHPVSEYCLLLDENGWPVDPKLDERMAAFFNDCLDITFARVEQDRNSTESFGSIFDTVCREKLGSSISEGGRKNPVLLWFKSNLELPSGASFDALGVTWNEDEQFGFDGVHAAVETSWKLVMEQMADGLDILHHSPVTQIRVVLPDGTTPKNEVWELDPAVGATRTNETLATMRNDRTPEAAQSFTMEEGTRQIEYNSRTTLSRSTKGTTIKPPKATIAPVPRFSRRIRGEVANVRRSARSTKGIIQKLQIGRDHAVCYDDPSRKSQGKKRAKRRLNQVDDNSPFTTNIEVEGDIVPSSSVQVKLQNGTVLEADAVVCTLPLGVLKIPENQPGHVKFIPPLPDRKRNAIQKLGCGLLNKCALSFPKVFWQDSDFLGMAENNYSYLILNTVSYTHKPILIFMYGGAFASKIEDWTDAEIVEDCMGVLRRATHKDIPDPVDYCVTRWGKEQYSRMAFTYIPPGVDGPKELDSMSQAIYDSVQPGRPLIMFAGEHTTPYHPSTMHGAFLSGIREAYRYDLFMEPALNGYMEFQSSEHIYQHTFHMKRVYETATSPKGKRKVDASGSSKLDTSGGSGWYFPIPHEKRSRRQGFGGMTLRKRPKIITDLNPTRVTTKTATKDRTKVTPESGTRRNKRSLAPLNKASTALSFTSSPQAGSVPQIIVDDSKKMNQMEDRTLIRALDSYGRDCSFIRSKVLPIYGFPRKRSVLQIRNRWKQLNCKINKIPEEVWGHWKAGIVIEDKDEASQQNLQIYPPASSSSSRKSHRALKPRLFLR
jgi:hypothetical protein